MRIEERHKKGPDGVMRVRGCVIVAETQEESRVLDLLGSRVSQDGLIVTGKYEVRLSDGYGQHYVYLEAPEDQHWTVNPAKLPELTDEERKVLGELPKDAVRHWMRGETFDFSSRRWIAKIGDPKPDEYEFHIRSGFGGDILEETYKCKACGCFVEYTP